LSRRQVCFYSGSTAVSLGTLIGRASRPNIVVVGRAPGTEFFRDSARHQEVEILPDVLMLRIDAAIWFGNAEALVSRVERELLARPAVRHVVLVMPAVSGVDSTGLLTVRELNRSLAELHGEVFKSPAHAFRRLGGNSIPPQLPLRRVILEIE